METAVANYLAAHFDDDRIERRRPSGARDRGDIGGVRSIRGGKFVIEVKDYGGSVHVKPWLDEAEVERGNADADYGVVVFKRARVGYGDAGEQGVLMTLATFARLLEGAPGEYAPVVVLDPHTEVMSA